jgi:hypothetical protein
MVAIQYWRLSLHFYMPYSIHSVRVLLVVVVSLRFELEGLRFSLFGGSGLGESEGSKLGSCRARFGLWSSVGLEDSSHGSGV